MTTSSAPRNAPADPSPDPTTAIRGIIGRRDDPQVASVAASLRRGGTEPVVLDLSRFPGPVPTTSGGRAGRGDATAPDQEPVGFSIQIR